MSDNPTYQMNRKAIVSSIERLHNKKTRPTKSNIALESGLSRQTIHKHFKRDISLNEDTLRGTVRDGNRIKTFDFKANCYLYIAEQIERVSIGNSIDRWFKIGISNTPSTRVDGHRGSNPNILRLIYTTAFKNKAFAALAERRMLKKLKQTSLKSHREWVYSNRSDIIEYVNNEL